MNFFRISELPFFGCGTLTEYPGAWDNKQAMSSTTIKFTPASGIYAGKETIFLYYRGANDLQTSGGRLSIGVMTADPVSFNGRNWDRHRGINPVIPFDAVGTLPVLGGDYNALAVINYGGNLLLFIDIHGNPSGSERIVLFSSPDGVTFTYVQEIQYNGGYFNSKIGAIYNLGETLWVLCSRDSATTAGHEKGLRKSVDGGITWTDYGRAVSVNPVTGTYDSHSLIVGRGFHHGDYLYALIPAMPYIGLDGDGNAYDDWPEGIGLYRCHVDNLGRNNFEWDHYSRNPVMLRGPTEGGAWQLSSLDIGGSWIGPYQTWAVPEFENIDTANMNLLRYTPYAGTNAGWSTKHMYTARMGSTMALTDWDKNPFPPGNYALRNVATGNYIALDGTQVVLTEKGSVTQFAIAKQLGFYTLSNGGLCLRAPGATNNAAVLMEADPGASTNQKGEWLLEIWEDAPADQPQIVVITNRFSSLSLAVKLGADAAGAIVTQTPFIGSPAMLWEVVPIITEGTTGTILDPAALPMPTPLPNGDLVGATADQVLSNKSLFTLVRSAAVTANTAGRYANVPDGQTGFFGGFNYRRVSGSAAIADFPGWEPVRPISVGHWGILRSTVSDVTTKLQALIYYAESIAIGVRDKVEICGTGAPMTVSGPLYNTAGSLIFTDWQLVAAAGSWGSLTYATSVILGDDHPVATAMLMIGGRYATPPNSNNISPTYGPGFRLDGNRYAMGVLAQSGITNPSGEPDATGGLVYNEFLGSTLFDKWTGSHYLTATTVSSDENVPAFRTCRGLWSVTGDNALGQIHASYCRENLYLAGSPFFAEFVHTFGGWAGSGPDWTTFVAATTTITVNGSGVVLTAAITSAGVGYSVGSALFVDKYAGDMAGVYGSNRHQDPDNWPGLCCLIVTSVNGSGGITGLRVASDRHGTNAWGTGYTAGVKTLHPVQRISPRGISLVGNGGITGSRLYQDKCIIHMYGSFKARFSSHHIIADDELPLKNLFVFKAKSGGRDILVNFDMPDIHWSFSNTYGTYDARNIIYVDETETAFTQCSAHIGLALPTQQDSVFRGFPTTIGKTERYLGAETISGSAGGYYLDWDLGDVGFAGELYRLPGAKALRFSSLKDSTKTLQYRYLADNPLIAPATTDVTVRRHTVRVYLDDNTRDGGDVVRAEWNGIVRPENAAATALFAGPAYIHLPDPAHAALDFSALWSGANAGVLGTIWSSRSGLYQDTGATVPCTAAGQAVNAWVDKRGILTAVAAAGEDMVYQIDANGVPYVQGVGTLKRLITPNYNMSSVGVVSIFAAAINKSDSGSATLFNNNGLLTKSWRLTCPANTSFAHGVTVDGGAALSLTDTVAAKPLRFASVATIDLPNTTLTYQINGRDKKTTIAGMGGATVWDNKPIAIGGRVTTATGPVTADIYELGFFGKLFTDAEILLARKMLASAVGVVLNA